MRRGRESEEEKREKRGREALEGEKRQRERGMGRADAGETLWAGWPRQALGRWQLEESRGGVESRSFPGAPHTQSVAEVLSSTGGEAQPGLCRSMRVEYSGRSPGPFKGTAGG